MYGLPKQENIAIVYVFKIQTQVWMISLWFHRHS